MDLSFDYRYVSSILSMAAAVILIISIIVISISMIAFKKLHAFDMEDV